MRRPALGCIGAGRLARALLPALVEAGYAVAGISARGAARGRRLARRLQVPCFGSAAELARRSDILLLAVPDRALLPLARELAAAGVSWGGRVVLHHAGALGCAPLRPLRRAGAAVGVLHPLQTLGVRDAPLRGSWARVEGDARAVRVARQIARQLGLRPFLLPPPARRGLYHAAASLASNDLVALLTLAEAALTRAGLTAAAAHRAIASLAQGSLAQWARYGLPGAFTGPLARGDSATVAAQRAALARSDRVASAVHRTLSRALLALARRQGLMGRRQAEAARKRLGG